MSATTAENGSIYVKRQVRTELFTAVKIRVLIMYAKIFCEESASATKQGAQNLGSKKKSAQK